MERLDCHVKEYAWGKKGEKSEVAQLFSAGHEKFQIGKQTPYAELWMGTHPDGPAKIRNSSECLSKMIARKSENNLFTNLKKTDDIHLPFIMKIMSIKHTLSLQVHPTKKQASWLHELDPINYPDRNHKPELAYALTRFELLCGFRPADQIIENMKAFPEFCKIMGEQNCDNFINCYNTLKAKGVQNLFDSIELKDCLRKCFEVMLNQQVERPKFVIKQLQSLYQKLNLNVRGCLIEETVSVMYDTYKRFPNDVGCFGPLYLNHMILEPGQCCYYAAEELHAYLSGECVECVGCSNNTIRAGLTPKFIDRKNLTKVLNYRMTDPEFYIVKPKLLPNSKNIVEFSPNNCEDFTLHEIQMPIDEATSTHDIIDLPALDCPSIIVVVEGTGNCENLSSNLAYEPNRPLNRGDIFYIAPSQKIRLNVNSIKLNNNQNSKTAGKHRFLAYRTFSYSTGPDHSNRLIKPFVSSKNNFPASKLNAEITKPIIIDYINDDGIILKKKLNSNIDVKNLNRSEVLFEVESEMDGFL